MNLSEQNLLCPKSKCKTKLEIKMNPKNYQQFYCKNCNSNPEINDVLKKNKIYLIHDLKHCGERVHPTDFDDIDVYVCEGCEFKVDVRKLRVKHEDLSKTDADVQIKSATQCSKVSQDTNAKNRHQIKLDVNIAKPIDK